MRAARLRVVTRRRRRSNSRSVSCHHAACPRRPRRAVTDTPIADYALLSDCHSAALVSRDGSVDWLCFPRFDSPSVFARILDEGAGHWSIRPVGQARSTRRYQPDTLVLETTYRTKTGTARVVDALAVGRN